MTYPDFDLVWYIPGLLCGGMRPRSESDLELLVNAGVKILICLKESPTLFAECLSMGITPWHLPVPDFSVPTHEVIIQAGTLLEKRETVFLHCHAGLGRTGTVAAALLIIHQGMSPRDALETVRKLRPGSVETEEQEMFILSLGS